MHKNNKSHREFLRAGPWDKLKEMETEQQQGLSPPPYQKSCEDAVDIINLPPHDDISPINSDLKEVLWSRRSRRDYSDEYIDIDELSFMLAAAQGTKGEGKRKRIAPSAGARYPFETYLAAGRIKSLNPGIYRYLPRGNKLALIYEEDKIIEIMGKACHSETFNQQKFIPDSAAVFVWTSLPRRTEWRYGRLSPRLIALEAGHICQNLYLAGEALNTGICAIGAYDQEEIDSLLEIDGRKEFAVYAATAGKNADRN